MKIVLITLHVRPSAQAVPLAAGCLVAALPEKLRCRATLLDHFVDRDEESLLAAVLSAGPRLAAFPLYAWNREKVLALARRLKELAPSLFLVAGGPEAGTDPEGILGQGFDAVIRGEGETAFRELVEALAGGRNPEGIDGLLLNGPGGGFAGAVVAPPSPPDEWASPWLEGVLVPEEAGGVLWELSRGCPFACDFCFDARGSSGVRHIPAARMEAELDLFVAAGVTNAWVLDSTFNFPPERGKALLRLIARKAPAIHFHLEAKADFLDRETVRLLARIHCSVQVGLQSARPEVLANIHRTFDPALFSEKMHLLASEGVTFGLDLIYGLPGDDFAGFCRSLDYALGYGPNHVDIFPLAVLPGTPLHRNAERFGIRAETRPPYRLLESASCDAGDMGLCRRLAAAADLFYNLGRAVGFFPALIRAARLEPSAFLLGFSDWVPQQGIAEKCFLDPGTWEPEDILGLQEGYVRHLFGERSRLDLLPAAIDLIRYHFHHAETLLGSDLVPSPVDAWSGKELWEGRWRRAPNLRLVPFSYEVMDLEAMGEADLEQFAAIFRPVGSLALFFRREAQVYCESLEEDFARLLQGCDGRRRVAEVFSGSVNRRVGEEIVEFALAEGFLVPVGDGNQEGSRSREAGFNRCSGTGSPDP